MARILSIRWHRIEVPMAKSATQAKTTQHQQKAHTNTIAD